MNLQRPRVQIYALYEILKYSISVSYDAILSDIEHKRAAWEKNFWIIPTSDNMCSFNSYAKPVRITHRISSVYANCLVDENDLVYFESELTTSKQAAYHLAFQKFPHAKFLIERDYES